MSVSEIYNETATEIDDHWMVYKVSGARLVLFIVADVSSRSSSETGSGSPALKPDPVSLLRI